ncbi:MarR family winged helix-turn-helix transcriptional regulator [Vibrio sp. VB16]|uniref:MarR family winged helix-turn-helix transcriptional regulator n=1 Tax=Vibrio sp. VB16 TaxID=2785746 RepID=UPI00189E824A|nr:MarR family transcriptional regulator [Vibrio sp. VB16]UGA54251.1 MarR family transcriptional regulator [Vibrio sp. VB16]
MSFQTCLIDLERFMSKEWRVHAKDDPLSSLSFNEFDYLKVIQYSSEPIRITDLASEMMVTKPSASNMVVRLERKALVRRISCPEDARAKRVVLTDKAIEGLSTEDSVLQIITEKLENKVSKQESEQLVKILSKMLK